MPPANTPLPPRRFNRTDFKRSLIVLLLAALTFGIWWLLLPALQWCVLPRVPGSPTGPWILRPILAFHFAAATILTAFSMPLSIPLFRRRWVAQDAFSGTQYNPFHARPLHRALTYLKAGLLALVYAAGLVFYLSSWTLIGPDGITLHFPWGPRTYPYTQIQNLQTIPQAMRSNELAQDGPWYEIQLSTGRSITFSLSNEGSSPSDLAAIASYIARQSAHPWHPHPNATPQ